MAKETTQETVGQIVEKINKGAEINEAYFVGLLWSDPFTYYAEYNDTVNEDEFIHDHWGFFFELGRRMYDEGIKTFDTITVHTKVKEWNVEENFNEYGGLNTVEDAVEIVKEHSDNIDYYYETIKRNYTLRQLYLLFGDKIFLKRGKYDFEKMTREQLSVYWNDKVNQVSLANVNRYEAEDLYIEADEFIRKLEEESAEMLPFYNGEKMDSITQGVARGHVYMWGGFGGTGKSSITAEKVVMSCIANGEKAIVVLNEEDAQQFRQKIVLTILWTEYKMVLDRKRLVNGDLTEEDKVKIKSAFAKMKEMLGEDNALIKVIFMEKYVIKDLEKIVRFWANRGYINLIIDTHKVSEESEHDTRWVTFVEDMKTIYRLTRKNAGGMNLRTWVTFQLADSALRNRFLDYDAIGEGKASKNEASVVQMFRPAWSDEYKDGKKELKCWRWKKLDNGDFIKKQFFLEEGKTYYLVFTAKNRFGQANDTGLPVLIIEPHFHTNTFPEIGWCFVSNEKSGR
ncbi:replicative DNA helicase [Bacillus phage vB_BanS-Thrax2]|nr:replicative DNA helicase [Bacillus phage vB_BanS-Thrax2]